MPMSYTSTKSLFFYSCLSDDAALNRILEILLEALKKSGNCLKGNSFTGIDEEVICPRCHEDIRYSDPAKTYRRKELLHTLHHGSIEIGVMDFFCRNSRQWIIYVGFSDSLFCLNKLHLFTRELLDSWLWNLCGTKATFRDTFTFRMTQGLASSASFHHLGREIELLRVKANESFSMFLKTLWYLHDEDLYSLFSCSKCELNPDSPSRDLSGVVVDGTKIGISGTSSDFQRDKRVVSPVSKVADKQ